MSKANVLHYMLQQKSNLTTVSPNNGKKPRASFDHSKTSPHRAARPLRRYLWFS